MAQSESFEACWPNTTIKVPLIFGTSLIRIRKLSETEVFQLVLLKNVN